MNSIHKNLSQREACQIAGRLGVRVSREKGELVFRHPSFGVVRAHFGKHDAGLVLVSALRKAARDVKALGA